MTKLDQVGTHNTFSLSTTSKTTTTSRYIIRYRYSDLEKENPVKLKLLHIALPCTRAAHFSFEAPVFHARVPFNSLLSIGPTLTLRAKGRLVLARRRFPYARSIAFSSALRR